MRKLLMPGLVLAAILLVNSCRNHHSGTYIQNDGNRKTTISINDQSGSLKIVKSGDISFTDDDQQIAGISHGGYLKYTKNGKKLLVENKGGEIIYRPGNGDTVTELDENGRRFLAEAIKVMIRHGIDAQARVERLYKKGGSQKVLDEVAVLESDYVKRIYLEFLLSRESQTKNEMLIAAHQISTLINSDYDKAQLLEKFSKSFTSDAETTQAYLVAVKSIASDYEKSRALKSMFSHQLDAEQYADAISIVNNIGSDYEKAELIKGVLKNRTLDSLQYAATVKAIGSINSDYEKSGVLKNLMARNQVSPAQLPALVKVINGISSDYERAGVIKELAEQPISTEDEWVEVIGAAAGISSEYEKSNALTEIAGRMGTGEKVKAAYSTAAKTITSEHEYKKAMEAMR